MRSSVSWGGCSRSRAASVDGLFVLLIDQNLFVEFELFNQSLDFLDADIAGHDQPEAGVFRQ